MCALLKIYRLVNCGMYARVCVCVYAYIVQILVGLLAGIWERQWLCNYVWTLKAIFVAFLNEHTLFVWMNEWTNEWKMDRVCMCEYLFMLQQLMRTQLIANISTIYVYAYVHTYLWVWILLVHIFSLMVSACVYMSNILNNEDSTESVRITQCLLFDSYLFCFSWRICYCCYFMLSISITCTHHLYDDVKWFIISFCVCIFFAL